MEKFDNDFGYIFRKLSFITRQMKITSILIFFILVLNIVAFVLLYFSYASSGYFYFGLDYQLISVVLPFIGMLMILFHYILKHRGQIYYEEIADEFEWGFKKNIRNRDKAPIRIRIIIKEYLRAAELPLIPNQYGHIIYFILFILILAMSVLSRGVFIK